MGLFDGILGNVLQNVLKGDGDQIDGNSLGGMLNGALANTQFGDLNGILAQLQSSGLGAHVASWLGNGSNLPISVDEIRSALGNEQLQKIGAQFGIPVEQLSGMLAQYLPATVDQLSPDGKLTTPT